MMMTRKIFKGTAFDQLWFEGYLGKLKRMVLSRAYLHWIDSWLHGRQAYIEKAERKSRWINMLKSCPQPQGSIRSPHYLLHIMQISVIFMASVLVIFFLPMALQQFLPVASV
jgi:hypothetical protein